MNPKVKLLYKFRDLYGPELATSAMSGRMKFGVDFTEKVIKARLPKAMKRKMLHTGIGFDPQSTGGVFYSKKNKAIIPSKEHVETLAHELGHSAVYSKTQLPSGRKVDWTLGTYGVPNEQGKIMTLTHERAAWDIAERVLGRSVHSRRKESLFSYYDSVGLYPPRLSVKTELLSKRRDAIHGILRDISREPLIVLPSKKVRGFIEPAMVIQANSPEKIANIANKLYTENAVLRENERFLRGLDKQVAKEAHETLSSIRKRAWRTRKRLHGKSGKK